MPAVAGAAGRHEASPLSIRRHDVPAPTSFFRNPPHKLNPNPKSTMLSKLIAFNFAAIALMAPAHGRPADPNGKRLVGYCAAGSWFCSACNLKLTSHSPRAQASPTRHALRASRTSASMPMATPSSSRSPGLRLARDSWPRSPALAASAATRALTARASSLPGRATRRAMALRGENGASSTVTAMG